MERYTGYILKRTIGPLLLICFVLAGIAWLSQSLRFIDMIVNRGLSFSTFIYFSSLLLPSLLWVILPLSLFISLSLVYQRLMLDSELTALKTAGINKFGLAKPAITLGILATLFTYVISLYLLPASYREFKDLQNFIRDNYISVFLQEGVFTNPTDGLTVYIRSRDDKGTLYGMLVHDDRDPNLRVTMMAESGQLVRTPAGPRFLFIKGNRQEYNTKSDKLSFLFFDRYALDLNLFIKNTEQQRWREPKERYLYELLNPKDTPDHLMQVLAGEANFRITWPLINLVMCMLAILPFVRGEFQRRHQWKRVVAIYVLAILASVAMFALYNMSSKMAWAGYGLYGFVGFGIISTFYLLLTKRSWTRHSKTYPAPGTHVPEDMINI